MEWPWVSRTTILFIKCVIPDGCCVFTSQVCGRSRLRSSDASTPRAANRGNEQKVGADESELREMIDGRKLRWEWTERDDWWEEIDFEEIWKWSAKWGQCEIRVKKRWNSLKGKTAVVVVGNEGFQRKGKERFLSHTSRLKKNPSNHIDPIIMSGLGKYSQFFWCFQINPIISLAYSWKTTIPVQYIGLR